MHFGALSQVCFGFSIIFLNLIILSLPRGSETRSFATSLPPRCSGFINENFYTTTHTTHNSNTSYHQSHDLPLHTHTCHRHSQCCECMCVNNTTTTAPTPPPQHQHHHSTNTTTHTFTPPTSQPASWPPPVDRQTDSQPPPYTHLHFVARSIFFFFEHRDTG